MIIGINQPYYLPYVGLFDRIKFCDRFVINGYSKLNRDRAKHRRVRVIQLHPDAKVNHIYLTQSITRTYDRMPFYEIGLNEDFWQVQALHSKTLYYTYRSAPFFEYITEVLDLLTDRNCTNLGDFNFRLIFLIAKKLGLDDRVVNISTTDFDCNLLKTDNYGKFNDSANYQNYIICKHFAADKMIVGQNGPRWVDEGAFKENGIEIYYQKVEFAQYRQFSPGWHFVKGLSAVDLLANCGERAKYFIGRSSRVVTKNELVTTIT